MVPDACEWIFFDCFNTLLDDFEVSGGELGLGGLPALAVELGLAVSSRAFVAFYRELLAQTRRSGREMSLQERLSRIAGIARPGQDSADLVERALELWQLDYSARLRPAPGVREMLEHWRGRRRLGVISNFAVAGLPAKLLTHWGLGGAFEFVVDSAAFGYKKPDLRVFRHALELACAEPPAVFCVGDRFEFDLAPARALGMSVLHFNRERHRPGAAPTPPGVASIHDWSEFR